MKKVASYEAVGSESDEDTGLIFFDPKVEARLKKEKEMLENQRNRANLLAESNNGPIGSTAGIMA